MKDRTGRHRYVVFEIRGGEDLETGEVIRTLREASQHLVEESRPWLVSFELGLGVVRCSHRAKDEVIQLLQTIQRVGSREVQVRTLGTSGTVRRALKKYVRPRVPRADSI